MWAVTYVQWRQLQRQRVIRPGEWGCFCAIDSWPDCLASSSRGCPCSCFLQRIRRLKQDCFLIQLKKIPATFIPGGDPWKSVLLSVRASERADRFQTWECFLSSWWSSIQSKAGQKKKKKGPGEVWAQSSKISCPKRAALPPVRPPSSSTGNRVFRTAWAAKQGLWFWRFLSMAA